MKKQRFLWFTGFPFIVGLANSQPVDAAQCPANQINAAATLSSGRGQCEQVYLRAPKKDPDGSGLASCRSFARSAFVTNFNQVVGSGSDCLLKLTGDNVLTLWDAEIETVIGSLIASWSQPPQLPPSSRITTGVRNRRFSTIVRVLALSLRQGLATEERFTANQSTDAVRSAERDRLTRKLTRRLRNLTRRADYNGPAAGELTGAFNTAVDRIAALARSGAALNPPTINDIPAASGGLNRSEGAAGIVVTIGLPEGLSAGARVNLGWGSQPVLVTALSAEQVAARLATISVPFDVISAQGDGNITVSATLTDTNGNTSTAATTAVLVDLSIPGAPLAITVVAAEPSPLEAIDVAAGNNHTCALLSNNSLKCWGSNSDGQLGVGDNLPRQLAADVPFSLGSETSPINVELGANFSCLTADDDTARCWGAGTRGQLGQGNTLSLNQVPDTEINFNATSAGLSLFAGSDHACRLFDDGSGSGSAEIDCWGENAAGQLGTGSKGDFLAQPRGTSIFTGAAEIAAGLTHTCVRSAFRNVSCWGSNGFGQLGAGDPKALPELLTPSSPITLPLNQSGVTAGRNFNCARDFNGPVRCWGDNGRGQLGLGDTTLRALPAGLSEPAVDLGGADFAATDMDAGSDHVCAVVAKGQLKCWGANDQGQLGLGDTLARGDGPGEMGTALPGIDLAGRLVVQISSGGEHTCARLDDGGLKCWGRNAEGQLGLNDTLARGDGADEMGASLPEVNLGVAATAPTGPAASIISRREAKDGIAVRVSLPAGTAGGDTVAVQWGSQTPVSHTVTGGEATEGSATVIVPGPAVLAAASGAPGVTATLIDAAGNQGASVATTTTVDLDAPPAPQKIRVVASTETTTPVTCGTNCDSTQNLPTSVIQAGLKAQVSLPASRGGQPLIAGDQVRVTWGGLPATVQIITATDIANGYVEVPLDGDSAGLLGRGNISDGLVLYTASLLDQAGNISAPAADTVTLDFLGTFD